MNRGDPQSNRRGGHKTLPTEIEQKIGRVKTFALHYIARDARVLRPRAFSLEEP